MPTPALERQDSELHARANDGFGSKLTDLDRRKLFPVFSLVADPETNAVVGRYGPNPDSCAAAAGLLDLCHNSCSVVKLRALVRSERKRSREL